MSHPTMADRAFDLASGQAVLAMHSPAPTPTALEAAWLQRWPEARVREVTCEAYGWLDESAAGGAVH